MANVALSGDSTEAGKWIPYAKKLIKTLRVFSPIQGAKTVTVAPGVKIAVHYYKDYSKIYIEAAVGAYLETGFVECMDFNEARFANIYLNNYIKSLKKKSIGFFNSGSYKDVYKSKVIR